MQFDFSTSNRCSRCFESKSFVIAWSMRLNYVSYKGITVAEHADVTVSLSNVVLKRGEGRKWNVYRWL